MPANVARGQHLCKIPEAARFRRRYTEGTASLLTGIRWDMAGKEPEELARLRKDPSNYRWGVFYCCARDPRVIVPKRPEWAGWTVNFAHPGAFRVILMMVLTILVPVFFTALIWPRTDAGIVGGLVLGIVALFAFCLRADR